MCIRQRNLGVGEKENLAPRAIGGAREIYVGTLWVPNSVA